MLGGAAKFLMLPSCVQGLARDLAWATRGARIQTGWPGVGVSRPPGLSRPFDRELPAKQDLRPGPRWDGHRLDSCSFCPTLVLSVLKPFAFVPSESFPSWVCSTCPSGWFRAAIDRHNVVQELNVASNEVNSGKADQEVQGSSSPKNSGTPEPADKVILLRKTGSLRTSKVIR